jgi:hypothetical protein
VDPITAAELWALVSGLQTNGWRRNWRKPIFAQKEQKELALPPIVSI